MPNLQGRGGGRGRSWLIPAPFPLQKAPPYLGNRMALPGCGGPSGGGGLTSRILPLPGKIGGGWDQLGCPILAWSLRPNGLEGGGHTKGSLIRFSLSEGLSGQQGQSQPGGQPQVPSGTGRDRTPHDRSQVERAGLATPEAAQSPPQPPGGSSWGGRLAFSASRGPCDQDWTPASQEVQGRPSRGLPGDLASGAC